MHCERYTAWINDGALSALDRPHQAELRGHLAACAECRAELERQRRLLAAIDRAVIQALATEPSPRLMAQIRQKVAAASIASELGRRVWPEFRAWRLAAIAAACAVALTAGLVWRAHRPALRRPETSSATVGRELRSPERPKANVPVATGRKPQTRAHSAKQVARLRRTGARFRNFRRLRPAVIVQKDEAALVLELYNAARTGRIKRASLVATPPGFKRDADGSLSSLPLKIQPIEIARLDTGSAK